MTGARTGKAEMARKASFYLWIGLQVLCESMLLVGNGDWNFLRVVDGSLATPRVIFLV